MIADTLALIRRLYGPALEAAAQRYRHRVEVLAGIMMRETEGGTSRWLDKPGPEGRGDSGHGHGLMQIDDRSFPEFIASGGWKDPERNIAFGARVLNGKRAFLAKHLQQVDNDQLERAAIAAYNCGEGKVLKLMLAGEDPDVGTAHGDYAKCVLQFAEAYRLSQQTGGQA